MFHPKFISLAQVSLAQFSLDSAKKWPKTLFIHPSYKQHSTQLNSSSENTHEGLSLFSFILHEFFFPHFELHATLKYKQVIFNFVNLKHHFDELMGIFTLYLDVENAKNSCESIVTTAVSALRYSGNCPHMLFVNLC